MTSKCAFEVIPGDKSGVLIRLTSDALICLWLAQARPMFYQCHRRGRIMVFPVSAFVCFASLGLQLKGTQIPFVSKKEIVIYNIVVWLDLMPSESTKPILNASRKVDALPRICRSSCPETGDQSVFKNKWKLISATIIRLRKQCYSKPVTRGLGSTLQFPC